MSRKRYTVTVILTSTQHKLSAFYRRIRIYVSLDHSKYLWRQVCDTARRVRRDIASLPEAWKESKKTWQGRERSTINDNADELDKQTLLEAYSSTLHSDALSAASMCLMDCKSDLVIDYFR